MADIIPRTPVTSSNVAAVSWADNQLTVEFKHGAAYRYKDVPRQVANELIAAESAGKFLNEHIKGVFEFEKVAA